jgi:hypothetical protein
MLGDETNPSAGLPDFHFDTLNQASADDGSEYLLPALFEPRDSIVYCTQPAEGDRVMGLDPQSTPTSSGLRSEHDSLLPMLPTDESPIISEASRNTSSANTQPAHKISTGEERSTAGNHKRKRGPRQDTRTQTEKREQAKQQSRVAANKSRKKKREIMGELEERSSILEAQNYALHNEHERLRQEIHQLKCDLMRHANCNNSFINMWITNETRRYLNNLV